MTRRSILLSAVCVPALLCGDDRTDALDLVAPLAAALANEDRNGAGWAPPKALPNYTELRDNIAALIAQAVVTSSVDIVSVGKNDAELDWYMQIRSRGTQMLLEQRRGTVKISWLKRRLTLLEPASFFATAKAG